MSVGKACLYTLNAEPSAHSSTTSKVSRIQEAIDTENVPDLTAEEIRALEEAGSLLHKRVYMAKVFGD